MLIRAARSDDLPAVATLCLATAAGGGPVPPQAPEAPLLVAVYAEPYLTLEPSTARLLLAGEDLAGYAVGAIDSEAFYARWRASLPPVPAPPLPSPTAARLASLRSRPEQMLPRVAERYPSHLHINLLPQARGGGWGRRLLEHLLAGLAQAGSPGVHLGVDPANERAAAFYRRLGFRLGAREPGTDVYVRALDSGAEAGVTAGA